MSGIYQNVVLTGITFEDGAENTSGILEDAYWLPWQDIDVLAKPTTSTTPESFMTIAGPHTMKTGKSPIPFYTMFEKSGLDSKLAGQEYSKIFMPEVKLFDPQLSTGSAANFSIIKNQRGILLIRRLSGSGFLQIGTQGLYAKVKDGSVSTGEGPTGTPGIQFVIEAPSVHPYYDYQGILPVTGV